ncbi:hypothetical protein [Hymenobacter terrenus]|uniref:hypothetical protein n=1 Tax=Hymenobacter terrenus TaxID=1629124 RepID=UPI000619ACD4|nr:hypothetical protein [Hymenobacter terrenus]
MKHVPSFLLGLVLMSLCVVAQAQTTPAPQPKNQPVKSEPRPQGSAAQKHAAQAPSFIKDTAAFRRSGRPADGIQNLIRPKAKQ